MYITIIYTVHITKHAFSILPIKATSMIRPHDICSRGGLIKEGPLYWTIVTRFNFKKLILYHENMLLNSQNPSLKNYIKR